MSRTLRTFLAALLLAALATCAAAPAPFAAAARKPDLKTVLARHARALGGLDKLRALKGVRAQATLSVGGLQGTMRSFTWYPGRARAEMQIAFIRQVAVQDGGMAWTLDQSGQVKDITGTELQNLRSSTCLESYRYLLGGPREATVKFSKDSADSACYINLEIAAAGGTPVELCLDPVTYLPRKSITPSAAGRLQQYYSDFRDVAGVKMAFRVTQVLGGDATHSLVAETQSVEAVESLPDTLWRKPGASARDWSLPEGVRSVSVPVEVRQHHVFATVRVNGSEPLSFLLDTGAGMITLEKSRAGALGIKSEGKLGAHGVGGSADFSLGRVDSIAVGGALLRTQQVIIMDLPGFEGLLGRPLDGILGYDFLSRFTVTVDYAHHLLTVTEPGAFSPPATARVVPIEIQQNVPVTRASCDGKYAGRFVVDTGNNGSVMLHAPFVREHRLLPWPGHTLEMRSRGVGGEEDYTVVRMDSLVMGGLCVPRPLVNLSQGSVGLTGASTQLDGNIGGWILEKFAVTFDYAGGRMYLDPGPELGDTMSVGRIGWQLSKEKAGIEVIFVPPGCPAADAGFQEGDVLLKMEGQDITRLDVPGLRHITDQPVGTKLKFEIRRAGETRQLELTLRDVL